MTAAESPRRCEERGAAEVRHATRLAPFSCSRCTRALLATFAGLTMWVGLWDLLDAHLLPSLFDACLDEPNAVCGAVKLSLVAVGAFGLYLTRSLYGDSGSSGPVQFQRL